MAYPGYWTEEENKKFIVAIKKYGKNWTEVAKFIGTRTAAACIRCCDTFLRKYGANPSTE